MGVFEAEFYMMVLPIHPTIFLLIIQVQITVSRSLSGDTETFLATLTFEHGIHCEQSMKSNNRTLSEFS